MLRQILQGNRLPVIIMDIINGLLQPFPAAALRQLFLFLQEMPDQILKQRRNPVLYIQGLPHLIFILRLKAPGQIVPEYIIAPLPVLRIQEGAAVYPMIQKLRADRGQIMQGNRQRQRTRIPVQLKFQHLEAVDGKNIPFIDTVYRPVLGKAHPPGPL